MSKRTFYIYIEICHIDIYEIYKVGISISIGNCCIKIGL